MFKEVQGMFQNLFLKEAMASLDPRTGKTKSKLNCLEAGIHHDTSIW